MNEQFGLGISVYRSLNPNENNYENYKALAKIADNYITKTNKTVKLFAFDSEHENDIVAAHHIFNLAKMKENIEIIPYIGDEESFLTNFKECERMIAIRFHSAILSDIYKIPFLPIAYSNKMQNLMNDRNFTGELIKLEELTPEILIDEIVDKIISGEGLCKNFTTNQGSSNIHFKELEKLLKIDNKKL
ncbi:polysaccharide pyruvyl transferase family protein [Tepidibacillus marianensis]|uniref:polysaccharide pyruvyl transferase family protein n=1 Tax=Tepidibacillus marianensis TaxID=3131995 RepID=UPI0030D5B512